MPTQKFESEGKGLKWKHQGDKVNPISVRFPSAIAELLRSMKGTQDFIRAAVLEKLERDGIEVPKKSPPPDEG